MYLYFLGRVSDQDAQDLRSITLIDIVAGVKNFKGKSSPEAWGWCYRIARRKLAKYFEEKNATITDSMDPELLAELAEASTGDLLIKKRDQKIDVQAALEALRETDPDCFFILWDHFMVGMDYEELAAKAAKKVDAIRMRISRCAEKLEPHLN